jgi:hypothetical protein
MRTSNFGFIAALAALLIASPAHALSDSRCPQGAELRAEALRSEGAFGGLRWETLAIPTYKNARDSYCYERSVFVARPMPVSWPRAGIPNLFIQTHFTTSKCCDGGARAEDGELEYGAFPRKIGTQVYCGKSETKPSTLWGELKFPGIVPSTLPQLPEPQFRAAHFAAVASLYYRLHPKARTWRFIRSPFYDDYVNTNASFNDVAVPEGATIWTAAAGDVMVAGMPAFIDLTAQRTADGIVIQNDGTIAQRVSFASTSNANIGAYFMNYVTLTEPDDGAWVYLPPSGHLQVSPSIMFVRYRPISDQPNQSSFTFVLPK